MSWMNVTDRARPTPTARRFKYGSMDLDGCAACSDGFETKRGVVRHFHRAERAEGVASPSVGEISLFSLSVSSTIISPYRDTAAASSACSA